MEALAQALNSNPAWLAFNEGQPVLTSRRQWRPPAQSPASVGRLDDCSQQRLHLRWVLNAALLRQNAFCRKRDSNLTQVHAVGA